MRTKYLILLLIFILPSLCWGLTISNMQVSNHTSTSITISWVTDEISDGTVNYGLTTALGSSASDTHDDNDVHWVQISGLTENTTYYFEIMSGSTTDDNDGSYYTFKTSVSG